MVAYSFYTDTYHGGSITAEEWPAAEREASATLDRYKRIYTVTEPTQDAEKMAVCAVAEVLVYQAKAESGQLGGVTSASIGSVSTSFSTTAEIYRNAQMSNNTVYKAASLYLDIYRGVGGC